MRLRQQEQQARAHIAQYERSTASKLSDVYKSFSIGKRRAFAYCHEKCFLMNGYDLRIITHNVNIFTAGFKYYDPSTGVVKFYYITPSYDVVIDY